MATIRRAAALIDFKWPPAVMCTAYARGHFVSSFKAAGGSGRRKRQEEAAGGSGRRGSAQCNTTAAALCHGSQHVAGHMSHVALPTSHALLEPNCCY